jgi:hypothetical protein
MLDELAPVGGGNAFAHSMDEVGPALECMTDGISYKLLRCFAAIGGRQLLLSLNLRREFHFHAPKRKGLPRSVSTYPALGPDRIFGEIAHQIVHQRDEALILELRPRGR